MLSALLFSGCIALQGVPRETSGASGVSDKAEIMLEPHVWSHAASLKELAQFCDGDSFVATSGEVVLLPSLPAVSLLRFAKSSYKKDPAVRKTLARYFLRYARECQGKGGELAITEGGDLISLLYKFESEAALGSTRRLADMRAHIAKHAGWFGVDQEMRAELESSAAAPRNR